MLWLDAIFVHQEVFVFRMLPFLLNPVQAAFYDGGPREVAQRLLGKWLLRQTDQGIIGGPIVETEAYLSQRDLACHAARGQTPKNAAMFGPPGHAYVYVIHGRHCFNVVTEPEGIASAVLIRALVPWQGTAIMQANRLQSAARRHPHKSGETNMPLTDIARGPARLCEALSLDRSSDKLPLNRHSGVWIAELEATNAEMLDSLLQEWGLSWPLLTGRSVRIGVTQAKQLRLRYYVRNCPYVSGPKWLRR